MNIAKRIFIILIIQTAVLLSIIAIRQWTLNTGDIITLKTTPIDPRSLFSGDYVILNYEINAIPVSKDLIANKDLITNKDLNTSKDLIDSIKANETVYVVLVPKGQYWVAESIQMNRPEVSKPKIVIKGQVESKTADKIFVNYGIENYFIPEGEGKTLERPKPKEVITVKVAVDRFGNAAIAGVFVNDKEIYKEKLF